MAALADDDLEQLLDSALDDFQNLNLTSSSQRNGPNEGKKEENSDMPTEVQGLGTFLPGLKSKKKGKQKVAKDSHAEAVGQLREHTRKAVNSLGSMTKPELSELGDENLDNEVIEGLMKEFEELGGSKEMDTFVQQMMKNLLSKEVLLGPIKEVSERYPKWLEENKSKVSKEEYDRCLNQYQLMKEVSQVLETGSEDSSEVFDLMHKMQECGDVPEDIMQQIGSPNLFNICQLSPEAMEQSCSIM